MVIPRTEHKFVRLLCEKMVPDGTPFRVLVKSEPGAIINDCFLNVRKKIERDGGGIQHGWCIWELPGLFIEGEFHAVWVSPNGDIFDISPKKDGETEILFLHDPAALFDEAAYNRRDNVRIAILSHPTVLEYIKCAEDYIKFLEDHTSPQNPRVFLIKESEQESLLAKKASLQTKMMNLLGPYDSCPCQSGVKFKWCCGKTLG